MFILICLTLTYLFPPLAQPGNEAIVPQDDAYDIQQNVSISTRDAASLAAIITRKKGAIAALPVVLFYTTYDQGERDLAFGKTAADKGYVGVLVYARGIRGNLNDYWPYEHEGNDIYDVIDWISKQQWCNGKIGMLGGSYTGFAQWAAVKHLHPALKTIVPQVAVMPGYDTPMENNVCASVLCLGWPNARLTNKPLAQNVYNRWFADGSPYRNLDTLGGAPNRVFQKWLQHPAYDEYWRSLTPTAAEFSHLNIPVLSTTGYYDGAQIGALHYFKLHYKNNPNANHYLVIGPYDHPGAQRNPAANLMGYNIDPIAMVNMQDLAYQWLDYVLKNGKKPDLLKDRITYEVMGANEWRHAATLAGMSQQTLTFYLTGTAMGNDHLLSPNKPQSSHFLQDTVDFRDRQNQNNLFSNTIINNTAPSGALIFVSEPFAETVTISGAFSGELSAVIDKRDMDISIAFYELIPEIFCLSVLAIHQTRTIDVSTAFTALAIRAEIHRPVRGNRWIPLAAGSIDWGARILRFAPTSGHFLHHPNIETRRCGARDRAVRDEIKVRASKYFLWTSTRSFTDKPQDKRVEYPELMNKLRGPRNGLGDIYQIDLRELKIDK